jgi:hypothetical protein
MNRNHLPPASFQRLERVTVTGGGPYLGQQGTVLWRDGYYARREPDRARRWQYVVHLSDTGCCRTFFEAALESVGEFASESAHLGVRPEVSFDTVLEDDNAFIEGCYRVPGRFWQVIVFTRGHEQELRWMSSRWDSGITGTVFYVPATARLDRTFVLRALSQAFGLEGWEQVQGPDSIVLR